MISTACLRGFLGSEKLGLAFYRYYVILKVKTLIESEDKKMSKVRMYKVLIAVADSNSKVMDIMQYMATDNDINSEEFFELFTECKARIAEVLGTPANLKA